MNISVMMDLMTAGAVILFTALGWKRGLVRTLAELLVVVLALVISTQIASSAAPKIVDQALRPATHAAIEQRVDEMMEESLPGASPAEELGQIIEAIPNAFIREQAHGLLEGLEHSAEEALAPTQERLEKAGKDVADAVLDGVVRNLIQSILCAVCFLILTFLLRMAVRVLRIVEKVPGIRQLNELGGALVGFGKGLILVGLGLWILRQTGVITPEAAAGSQVFGLLSRWTGGLIG